MGRPRVGIVQVKVGLRVQDAERLSAMVGDRGRSRWVRELVAERLGDGAVRVSRPREVEDVLEAEVEADVREVGLRDDDRVLLEHLRQGSKGERSAALELDWMRLRVERSAGRLSKSGLVRYEGGLMVASV